MAAQTIITPDPSGAIHGSRLESADAEILALGRELEENRAKVDAEWERADALQEAGPDDAETRSAAWAIRDACRSMTDRYQEILNELRDRPAHTLPGMAVKSRAILRWLSPGGTEIPDDHEDGRVAWSLARDVLRLASEDPNPDAGLIATCAEVDRLEREITRGLVGKTLEEEDEAERTLAPLRAEQDPLLEKVQATRAKTIEGVRAKAATLALWDTNILWSADKAEKYWNNRMLRSVFCDLLGAEAADSEGARALWDRMLAGSAPGAGEAA